MFTMQSYVNKLNLLTDASAGVLSLHGIIPLGAPWDGARLAQGIQMEHCPLASEFSCQEAVHILTIAAKFPSARYD